MSDSSFSSFVSAGLGPTVKAPVSALMDLMGAMAPPSSSSSSSSPSSSTASFSAVKPAMDDDLVSLGSTAVSVGEDRSAVRTPVDTPPRPATFAAAGPAVSSSPPRDVVPPTAKSPPTSPVVSPSPPPSSTPSPSSLRAAFSATRRLITAVASGESEEVAALLSQGADANATLSSGQSLLMRCAAVNDLETARLLLNHGAEANFSQEQTGRTALMLACQSGATDIIAVLVQEFGANVNAFTTDRKQTPLLVATRKRKTKAVEMLVAAGATVNDADGNCPALFLAASNGDSKTVQALLSAGGNPNATASKSSTGPSALSSACDRGHTDVVELLYKAGAQL